MKYIRTAKGIFGYVVDEGSGWTLVKPVGNINLKLSDFNDTIIKEADTIEELCDEIRQLLPKYKGNDIIGYEPEKWEYSVSDKKFYNDIGECCYVEDFISMGYTVYGAIWIEIKLQNGKSVYKLEPVAILDEDGKLVLL